MIRRWWQSRKDAAEQSARADEETRRVLPQLLAGHTVTVPTRGSSMRPLIRSGDPVVVEPLALPVRTGQVVLRVRGQGFVLHRVIALRDGLVHTQGDNQWRADPPARLAEILGQATWVVRPSGLHLPLLTTGIWARAWLQLVPLLRTLLRIGRHRSTDSAAP